TSRSPPFQACPGPLRSGAREGRAGARARGPARTLTVVDCQLLLLLLLLPGEPSAAPAWFPLNLAFPPRVLLLRPTLPGHGSGNGEQHSSAFRAGVHLLRQDSLR
ncbi:unnamed protein product, partial [Ectocarpus sp. 13 AM-2016]